ncbi:hypothetical protein PAXRUDRAFT_19148 [Paxillus rubicundulus Ve08.2h10]|uniref:Unplaced genomic scaffold scaffold_3412, whole genome shotgun sequence n=1 Tax=Paxillus rubicundulus Ve08.2h10 TaxID=930991 RepID=A0A0D0CVZ6_9AGAM|nr:hypothetical protein PAXRUDRAFT_19148 [Paxillus rubicundulus Ve08.2h10]
MEAKAHAEEVAWAQSLVLGPSKGKQPNAAVSGVVEVVEQMGVLAPCYGCLGAGVACEMKAAGGSKMRAAGDMQPTRRRKWEELMSPWAGKKKVRMQSPVADEEQDEEEDDDEEAEEA